MKFLDLNLNKSLMNAIDDLAFETPTNIQSEVFSKVMSGSDVIGIANTGTGKTLAYLLPLIRMWQYSKDKLPTIIVLVPTQELVEQVQSLCQKLVSYMSFDIIGIHGGINPKVQIANLQQGCDLIIATPGRFIDLAEMGAIRLKNIKKIVLDEYDIMLDLGFKPQINNIFEKLPAKRQHLLFSATYSDDIADWAEDILVNPILVESNTEGIPENIEQKAFIIPNFNTKINFLELLLENDKSIEKALVFISEKALADKVYQDMLGRGIENISIIHGNKSYNTRRDTVQNFRDGNIKILISSDICSRGLDIADITHVINVDMPNPAQDYIHRIGRTGRNNKKGTAISLVSERELDTWHALCTEINMNVTVEPTPSFLEINDELMPFEIEKVVFKTIVKPVQNTAGEAFHEKKIKNQKVNVRRNIEKEKKLKYGKAYRKES